MVHISIMGIPVTLAKTVFQFILEMSNWKGWVIIGESGVSQTVWVFLFLFLPFGFWAEFCLWTHLTFNLFINFQPFFIIKRETQTENEGTSSNSFFSKVFHLTYHDSLLLLGITYLSRNKIT